MNIRKTSSQLLTESKKSKNKENQKKKLSEQPKQEQNHKYGNHLESYQSGRGKGRMGEIVQGLRFIS